METQNQFTVFPNKCVRAADNNAMNNMLKHLTAAVNDKIVNALSCKDIAVVAGRYGFGGILLTAVIRPIVSRKRSQKPVKMAIMLSITKDELINIEVREIESGNVHAYEKEVYVYDLSNMLLALDYDGNEVFDPALWDLVFHEDEEYGTMLYSPEELYEATHWDLAID